MRIFYFFQHYLPNAAQCRCVCFLFPHTVCLTLHDTDVCITGACWRSQLKTNCSCSSAFTSTSTWRGDWQPANHSLRLFSCHKQWTNHIPPHVQTRIHTSRNKVAGLDRKLRCAKRFLLLTTLKCGLRVKLLGMTSCMIILIISLQLTV